jgi:cellulose synthase/poly-beta-1,6-N-acetylglucosamine synthase-like glycosyltransferase
MTTFLDALLLLAGLPALLAATYLATLSCLWRRPQAAEPARSSLRFRILVPAHNEEAGIEATLDSIYDLDYPIWRYRVVVVADNCNDRTAARAGGVGARVIERADQARRGKGWALRHGIDTLLQDDPGWDALVVVDADTVVSKNLLNAVATRLDSGAQAAQTTYLPREADNGPLAVITRVALTAFHVVRSGTRERFGLSCGLRGNGMAFSRELLERIRHDAVSLTEDLEFGVQLGLSDVRVAWAGDATVRGDMPTDVQVVSQQRERWIGGRLGIARRFVPTLAGHALRRRSAIAADLAADLLIPPLSALAAVVIVSSTAAATLALFAGVVTPSLIVWLLAAALLSLHVVHAAHLAASTTALLRVAGALPGYIVGRTLTTLRSARNQDQVWIRTARHGEIA